MEGFSQLNLRTTTTRVTLAIKGENRSQIAARAKNFIKHQFHSTLKLD